MRVAVASISPLAAQAGARVAEEGGNAVDAAVAAALVSATTAPGMCSLGGAGFALVCPPGASPEAIDGGFEMPGRGLASDRLGGGRIDVHLEYAGGVDTTVGVGSVATPGAPALLSRAAERHGRLPWVALVQPALEHARSGFPLPAAAQEYLTYAHESIFGWNSDSRAALHDADGSLLPPGSTIRVPHLADTLERLAWKGGEDLYKGDLAREISTYILELGGILGPADLAAYRAVVRPPIRSVHAGWEVWTNPTPAVGGVVLTAMLRLLDGHAGERWDETWADRMARVQAAVLGRREDRLDASDQLEEEAAALLADVEDGSLRVVDSPSTVHTSTIDSEGLACAITLSDGYGSGAMAPGTGLWLNNALGEPELNPHGYHGWPPGHRLISNMAPTVARRANGSTVVIGSPGADRITTALAQVITNVLDFDMGLQAAVDHPRLHVELTRHGPRVALEPGLPAGELPFPTRVFETPSMFFGGVAAVGWAANGGFELGADTRRDCGVAIGRRDPTGGLHQPGASG